MPTAFPSSRPVFRQRVIAALLCGPLMLAGAPSPALALKLFPATGPREPLPAMQLTQPSFQPPSAQDCRRPVQTREIPGRTAAEVAAGVAERTGRLAKAEREEGLKRRDRRAADTLSVESDAAVAAAEAPAMAAPAPSLAAPSSVSKPADMAGKHSTEWKDKAPRDHALTPSPVTAGMVNDNADFTEYLAFRDRTQVPHQTRDVSQRYLLEVKDDRGRGIPDAVVEVRSPEGAVMWARSDAGGKVWLHPNAFDPDAAALYDVTVHSGQAAGHAILRRGQKSAVEVRIGKAPIVQRARLDLVFLIDATGSMGDEIDKLKASLQAIASDAARLPSQPDICFGLVAYRDKGDEFLVRSHDLTNDLAGFQKALNRLQANGGGDMPEAMSEALHETVDQLSWRGDGATRMVVLLADAPPQLGPDRPRYDDAMLTALGKGIKIFSVGASGLDPQGEYIHRQLAQFTGGRFVFLTYDRADDPASGPGRETVHDVKSYSVSTLDSLILRLIREELALLPIKSAKGA